MATDLSVNTGKPLPATGLTAHGSMASTPANSVMSPMSVVSPSVRLVARQYVGKDAPVGASERFATERMWHEGRKSRHPDAVWKKERVDKYKRFHLSVPNQIAMVLGFPLMTFTVGMLPFAIPEQPASAPVEDQWAFFAALALSAFLMFWAPMGIISHLARLPVKPVQQACIAAFSALVFAATILIAAQFVFPVPFSTVLGLLPAFGVCTTLAFYALPARMRRIPQVRHSVRNAIIAVVLLLAFITLWAIVCLLFMRLRVQPVLQAVLALTVPLTKHYVRKLFARHSTKTDADNMAAYCMLVEYFSSTFASILMGGAAAGTTVVLLSTDFVVNMIHTFNACCPGKIDAMWACLCPCCCSRDKKRLDELKSKYSKATVPVSPNSKATAAVSPKCAVDADVEEPIDITTLKRKPTHAEILRQAWYAPADDTEDTPATIPEGKDTEDEEGEATTVTTVHSASDLHAAASAGNLKLKPAPKRRRLSRVEVEQLANLELEEIKKIENEELLFRQSEVIVMTEFVELFVPAQYMLLMLFARYGYNEHMFPMVMMLGEDHFWPTFINVGLLIVVDLFAVAISLVAIKKMRGVAPWRVLAYGIYDRLWLLLTHTVLLWLFCVWLGVKHARADFSLGGTF